MNRDVVVLPGRPIFHLVDDVLTATTVTTKCGRIATGVSRNWNDFALAKGAAWLTTEAAVEERHEIGCRLCARCAAKAEGTA